MERRNYFDLLGLDCDAGQIKEKDINQAIEDWKIRLQNRLANEAANRESIREELALESDMRAVMGTAKTRNAEARALREERCDTLRKLLDIILVTQDGIPLVTSGRIRNVAIKLKLKSETIEKVYIEKGFSIIKPGKKINLNDYFLPTSTFNAIKVAIANLSKVSALTYPYAGKVKDLYDVACYFNGGTDADRDSYHKMTTPQLYSIMEAWSLKVATNTSVEGHILSEVFSKGTGQIFNTEENRRKYDRSVQRELLQPFFKLIKSAPSDFKKDEYFAEQCIATIRKSFPDDELARALYNMEAGLMQDPYEPVDPKIRVVCGSCKTFAEFRSMEEAQKAKCTVCGSPLYVRCPSCKKAVVPSGAEYCSCGFFIPGMHYAASYIKGAKQSLQDLNLDEARRLYRLAESSDPSHKDLASLERSIAAEESRFKKPLDELQQLIDTKQFCKAQERFIKLSASFPKIKIDAKKKLINDMIDQAQKRMPAENMPPAKRANICEEILQQVSDFQPALAVVGAVSPQAPRELNCIMTEKPSPRCIITWVSSGDLGVRYLIVRKENSAPKNRADGEVIATDILTLSFTDNSVLPGIMYGYAVYAYRRGVYSSPAVVYAAKLSELDSEQLKAIAGDGVCKFQWILPVNCIGVRIIRKENAIPPIEPNGDCSCFTSNSGALFEDDSVVNNRTYGYRLQCRYMFSEGVKYSEGITFMLTPELPPQPLKDVSVNCSGCRVTVKWKLSNSNSRSVMIRDITNNYERVKKGTVFSIGETDKILGIGQTYKNVQSLDMQAIFNIPNNSMCVIAIVSVSGANGIVSDIVQVSSVEPCEIDREKTKISGEKLIIVLKNVPSMLNKIHYFVNVKSQPDASPPWASIDQAILNEKDFITAEAYLKSAAIVKYPVPSTELYITVIGEYKLSNGKTVFSKPSKIRINNFPPKEIKYKFTWQSKGFSLFSKYSKLKLVVSSDADYTPKIKVIFRKDGHIPTKFEDKDNVVIHTIEETENGFEDNQYTYEFDDEALHLLTPGDRLRLLISAEDMKEFVIFNSDLENCTVPKSFSV